MIKRVFLEAHNIKNPYFGFGQFNYHLIKGIYAAQISDLKCTVYAKKTASLQEEFVFDEGKHKQIQLTLEGITCAACAWLIEMKLEQVPGVADISVNATTQRATVKWLMTRLNCLKLLSISNVLAITLCLLKRVKVKSSTSSRVRLSLNA